MLYQVRLSLRIGPEMFSKSKKDAFRALIVTVLMIGLMACEGLKERVGLTKNAPDEFTVITKAPLIIPPNFSLRPPRPGAKQLNVIQPSKRARKVLLKSRSKKQIVKGQLHNLDRDTHSADGLRRKPSKAEGAELQLLQNAGAIGVNSSIRQIVNQETSILAKSNSEIADRLIFWQEKEPEGATVNAEKESKRLREAAAAGDPPNKTATAIIKRRKRGLLEGLLP